ncbi:PilN domain-containing protein [Candidatus Peregrinibacteria bacterium]|jgi:hypothetical protein|nr:PilN domain-containing protein [Candidatus Peregrinibacteria bacterium]
MDPINQFGFPQKEENSYEEVPYEKVMVEEVKDESVVTEKKVIPFRKKVGPVQMFLTIIAVLALGYGIFLNYSAARTDGQTAVIQDEATQKELQLKKLQENKVKNVMVASKVVKQIGEVDVRWSEVLTLLIDATPDPIIYRSYSGNDNGTITTAVIAPSFNAVADLLDILQNKPFVRKVFVPSVVKGTSPTNAATYSFSLNVEYEK